MSHLKKKPKFVGGGVGVVAVVSGSCYKVGLWLQGWLGRGGGSCGRWSVFGCGTTPYKILC